VREDPAAWLKDERGRAELSAGDIRVTLRDGRRSCWKYPGSEGVPEGTFLAGDVDRRGHAEGLARELIAQIRGSTEVSERERSVLEVLRGAPRSSGLEVAQATDLTALTTIEILHQLVDRGLVRDLTGGSPWSAYELARAGWAVLAQEPERP